MQFCVEQFWIFFWPTGFSGSHSGQWDIVSAWRICSSVRINQLLTNTSWRKLGIRGSRVLLRNKQGWSHVCILVCTLVQYGHSYKSAAYYDAINSTICHTSKKQCRSFKNLKVWFMLNNFTCWLGWCTKIYTTEYWFSLHFMSTETVGNY